MAKPSLNYYQTVHVGKIKTDVIQFTTIQSAIDAITDNATGKRYAVMVHPGIYTEQVVMEDYIDLIAVGGREETIITHTAASANDETVLGENAMIKGFTIITVTNGGNTGRCVENATAEFEIEDCILSITDHDGNEVVFLNSANCAVRDCVIDSDGEGATGLSVTGGTVVVESTLINSNGDAIGMTGGTVTLRNSTVQALIDQDGGSLTLERCQASEVALGTEVCTFLAELTRFTGAFATADVKAHDIDLHECTFSNQNFNNNATGGGTLDMWGCTGINNLTNADGGTTNLKGCDIETLTPTAGTITAEGGRIGACGANTSTRFTWQLNDANFHVLQNMVIQDAIGQASSGDIIHLDAVRYEERITLKDGVHIEGATSSTDTPSEIYDNTNAAVVTAAGVKCSMRRVKITQNNATATALCVSVTDGADVLGFSHCNFGSNGTYAIHMTNGNVELDECVVDAGGIHLETNKCTITLDHSRITAGALVIDDTKDHSINVFYTDFGGNNITNNADGATTIDLRYCSDIGTFLDAGLAGTTVIDNTIILIATKSGTSPWTVRLARIGALSNTNGAGAITVYGGYIDSCADSTGDIYWWHDSGNELMVISGMKISDALTAAGSGDVIKVGKGTFAESGLVAEENVDIIGEGPDISRIVASDDTDPIIDVGNAVNITIRNLYIENTGTANGIDIAAGAAASSVRLENCIVVDSGGSGEAVTLTTTGAGAPSLVAFDTVFDATTTNIEISGAVVANVDCDRCRFAAGAAITSTGDNHTIDVLDSDFAGLAITVAANAPVINLTRCNDIGAITNLTGALTIEHCTTGAIETSTGTVTIEQSNIGKLSATGAATVNVYNSYITEAEPAAGTFSFYECYLVDIDANGGTVDVYGGTIEGVSDSANPIRWLVTDDTYRVITGMAIQHAIDHGTAKKTILIGPGTFTEALTFDAAAEEATLIGEGTDKTIIYQSAGTPVTFAPSAGWAGALCIENLTIQGVAMSGHSLVSVDSSAFAASLVMRGVKLTGVRTGGSAYGVYTVGDENNAVELWDCDITMTDAATTYGIYSATDGVNTYTILLHECYISAVTDDLNITTDCTVTSYGCTYATGGITLASDVDCILRSYNDTILGTITKGVLAVMTCQADLNSYIVHNGMEIADALALAVAGDTVHLKQGVWTTDTDLSPATGVDIIGEGKEVSIIDASDAINPVFAIGDNISITIRNITIDNDAAGGAITISPVANNSALVLEDCNVISSAAVDCVVVSTGGAGSGTLTARRTDFISDAANSIILMASTDGGLAYLNATDCTFDTAAIAIELTSSNVVDVNVTRATFSDCALAVSSTGNDHTIDIDFSEFNGTGLAAAGVSLIGNAPVPNFTNCNDIGTFSHSIACTVTLHDCWISGVYTITAVVGLVNAYNTQFATFTNGGTGAIAFQECFGTNINNNSTSTMTVEGGSWDTVLQAAAAGTIDIYEAVIATELDCSAGGAINAYNCDIATVDANGGTVTVYGGYLRDVADVTGAVLWYIDRNTLKVFAGSVNMVIADALAAAGAGDTILVMPGTYAESNLTLVADVNLVGTDRDQCLIVTGNATQAILNSAVTCSLSNLTVGNTDAGAPAIAITTNTLTVRDCYIYGTGVGDAITMIAGQLDAYMTTIGAGDIDLSTAACTLNMYRCRVTTDPIDTAGAAIHVMTLEQCDLGGQSIVSAATLATTLDMRGCSNVGKLTNDGTGPWLVRDSDVQDCETTLTGFITIFGGDVATCTAAAAGGDIVWWKDTDLIYVIPNMHIEHALTDPLLASGDTIMLGHGDWNEANLIAIDGVDIVGQGRDMSTISTGDDTNAIIEVGDGVNITLRDIGIENTGTAGAIDIFPVDTASTVVLEDCDVTNSGIGDCVTISIGGAQTGTLTANRCNFTGEGASSIIVLTQTAGVGVPIFNSDLCTFTTSGAADKAAIEAIASTVADVNVTRATFISCTLAVYSKNDNHTIDIDDSEFNNCGVELNDSAPVPNFTKCNAIGAFAHSTACTVTLRDCYVQGTYTIAAFAGVVNAFNTQFATFTNGGSGAIAFAECFGTDINNNDTSTMTIEGGHWDTVLQAAAAGTIDIYEAVIATELDCSAGGAINAYNCEVTDVDCNGGTITIYGGDLLAVTDATGTVLWRTGPLRYEVLVNMKIQDSLTAGAGGEVIIHAGTHTPANPGAPAAALTVSANTLVRGEGKATIIQGAGAATNITNLLVLGGANITVKDMKLELAAGCGTAAAYPNVIYATTFAQLWLENLWLVGDTSVADDGDDARQCGVYFTACTECKIINCRSEDNDRHGINISGSSDNNTIMGNTSQGNTQHGILVDAGDNNTITANISQGNGYNGVYISGASTNNTITSNTIQGNTQHGIEVAAASVNNTITGNTVADNDAAGTTYHGIYIYASNENVVTGNQCDANGLHGIYIFESDYCTVTGNGCHNQNTGDGINITGDGTHNADFNTVTGNVCTGNGSNGIEVIGAGDANENIVVANNLKTNGGAGFADAGVLTQTGHNIV